MRLLLTSNELFPIVTDTAKPISSAVGGTLADVWQGLIGDRVTAWRIRNAAGVNEKLGKELAKTGQSLNLDTIPEGVAFAWFQKATETDEPEIQELFAKLLANAASGNVEALKKRNIDLVSRLTPDDGRLLSALADQRREERAQGWVPRRPWSLKANYQLGRFVEKHGLVAESFDALMSLGILRIDRSVSYARTRGLRTSLVQETVTLPSIQTEDSFILTLVGGSLIDSLFSS